MRLQTILNCVERNKSFVYGLAKFTKAGQSRRIVVPVRPRKGSRAVCSGCWQKRGTYDRLEQREFEYVPLWGIAVFFAYRMRRVNCPRCGIKVEQVPWCDGKNQMTTTYRWFLARWAKRLSWSEVAAIFPTSWNSVCRAVEHAVEWGLAHRDLSGVTAIGVDEVAWQKGHRYLTLVYDISGSVKRLLAIGADRTEESLRGCLKDLGQPVLSRIKFVCSDMWRPYLNVLSEQVGQALHILDRFHIMRLFGKALDEIRAGEARDLKAAGHDTLLKHSRWCLLKRPENLTEKQTVKLLDLLTYNLRSIRAWILREDFQQLWYYKDSACAGKFLDEWCTRTMRSRLEPMKKIARTLRGHRELILNWFEAKGEMSSGAVEGLNNKVKLVTRRSSGFRHANVAKLALFHNLGRLPEPEPTHRFC